MEMWLFWLVCAGVLVLLELITQSVSTLCFAAGALVAMVTALLGVPVAWQIIWMAVAAMVAFLLMRPVIRRHNEKRMRHDPASRSNMDALIGRRAVVTHTVETLKPGRVKIDGDNWQARLADGTPEDVTVKPGEYVSVKGYDSIVLIVKKIN
ncbi:MAG: NfeD family protein [Bacteroides sp.]|nr:NfeD family protein [Bacteroides sp.]